MGLVCSVNYDNDDDYLIALVIEMIIPEVITPFYGGTPGKNNPHRVQVIEKI